jgi:hypothetical protein
MHIFKSKLSIINRCIILTFVLLFALTACSFPGSAKYQEFSNANGDFTISVRGSWTPENDVNGGSIVLDNADGTLSILVQRFGKDVIYVADINEFVGAYKASALTGLLSLSELKYTEPVEPIDGFVVSDAEYYETIPEAAAQALENTAAVSPDTSADISTDAAIITSPAVDTTTDEAVSTTPVIKACVIYLESDTAYYACVVTGRDDSFEVNIKLMLEAISTIEETAARKE